MNNMKKISPYWFLSKPIDVEHKYYVLMDFFQSIELSLKDEKYGEPILQIKKIHADLKSYQKLKKLTDKTTRFLSEDEMIMLNDIAQQQAYNDEIEAILEQSISLIDGFFEKINPYIEEIEKSLSFTILDDNKISKDKGYVIMRNNIIKKLKIYSWQFSKVNIGGTSQIGLLLSELLEPVPEYNKSNNDISVFFEKEVKNFNKSKYCIVITDLYSNKSKDEISFDLIKDRSIEFIVDNYKNHFYNL